MHCLEEAPPAFQLHEKLSALKVLIVDDNAHNREVLENLLDFWGVPYGSADSGSVALAQLQQAQHDQPYTLMITDYLMPEMDGLALMTKVQRDPLLNELRVILLSSSDCNIAPEAHYPNLVCNLSKPVRQSELYECLTQIVHIPPNKVIVDSSVEQMQHPLQGRVLLVEDNSVNQEVTLAMLAADGINASLAVNGMQALQRLRQEHFDLVLMDCQMPVMDGFATTAILRQQEAESGSRRIPVIALTANAIAGDRENCLARGMDDYLSKPFTYQKLHSILSRWLHNGQAANQTLVNSTAETPVSGEVVETILDNSQLDNIRALEKLGTPGLLLRVIELYLGEAPVLLAAMQQAVAAGDAEALLKAAHSLKNSSANLGAKRLAEVCKHLETDAYHQALAQAAGYIAEAETEFIGVKRVLNKIQNCD